MTNLQSGKQIAKTSLVYLGLALGLIAAVPLLAGLAYAVRFLIPLLIVAALVGLAFSPKVRRWFAEQADDSPDYKGLPFPTASLKLHPAHSWAKVEASGTRVGVDSLALAAIGKLSSVDVPSVGSTVEQGQTLFSLLRGERRLQVKAPVSGLVVGINGVAVENPAALAQSPYGSGWVVRLQAGQPRREATALMGGTSLRRWFRSEVDHLTSLLSAGNLGATATMADGGQLAPDIAERIDDAKWTEIAEQLFANPRDRA